MGQAQVEYKAAGGIPPAARVRVYGGAGAGFWRRVAGGLD